MLGELGITRRRGGYRDPESQAFIESWFSKLKERCVWRHEFETLDDARAAVLVGGDPLGDLFCALRTPIERRDQGATYTPQAIVGPLSNAIASAYAIDEENVSTATLIGPDGTIVATELWRDKIIDAIAKALGQGDK